MKKLTVNQLVSKLRAYKVAGDIVTLKKIKEKRFILSNKATE